MRGIRVVAQPGPNPVYFIRRHRSSNAASAHQNRALRLTADDGLANRFRKVRIVTRPIVECPAVHNLMPQLARLLDEQLLQRKPGMVTTESQFHTCLLVLCALAQTQSTNSSEPSPQPVG